MPLTASEKTCRQSAVQQAGRALTVQAVAHEAVVREQCAKQHEQRSRPAEQLSRTSQAVVTKLEEIVISANHRAMEYTVKP
jgi:hypothetical protein